MKIHHIILITYMALSYRIACGEITILTLPITELEKEIFSDGRVFIHRKIPMYMEKHGIDNATMLELLDENIQYHLDFIQNGNYENLRSARETMYSMQYVVKDYLPWIIKYTDANNPEKFRELAVLFYVGRKGLADMSLASNVMAQAWRSQNERDAVLNSYRVKSQRASPEDREKYEAFLRWANNPVMPANATPTVGTNAAPNVAQAPPPDVIARHEADKASVFTQPIQTEPEPAQPEPAAQTNRKPWLWALAFPVVVGAWFVVRLSKK